MVKRAPQNRFCSNKINHNEFRWDGGMKLNRGPNEVEKIILFSERFFFFIMYPKNPEKLNFLHFNIRVPINCFLFLSFQTDGEFCSYFIISRSLGCRVKVVGPKHEIFCFYSNCASVREHHNH